MARSPCCLRLDPAHAARALSRAIRDSVLMPPMEAGRSTLHRAASPNVKWLAQQRHSRYFGGMAWFLFIDESGQDHKESPYEVLAGVAVLDADLWDLIKELHDAEIANFGRRYSDGERELKGKAILKKKTFTKALAPSVVLPNEVPSLAKLVRDDGARQGSERNLKALSLAKIAYVTNVFSICENYDCRIFASIVHPDAPQTAGGGLRKDYGYLFERFFYFLEDKSTET